MGIKQLLKKTWVYPVYLQLNKSRLEKKFYRSLFIQNQDWNTAIPNSEEQVRWQIIESFIRHISTSLGKSKLQILDLGCGRGWLSSLLSNYGPVTGVEPVKPVSQYAQKLFPHIRFIHGTSKTLLQKKEFSRFDLIVSSEVIEHVKDSKKKDFVNDIYRLLEDHGFAIITTPRKEAEIEWRKYSSPGQPVEDWITEKELETLFQNNGFRPISVKRFSIPPANNAPAIEIYQLWLFEKI